MLIFYYDSITGLNYYYSENGIYLDVLAVQHPDYESLMELLYQRGILIVDSATEVLPTERLTTIISNY